MLHLSHVASANSTRASISQQWMNNNNWKHYRAIEHRCKYLFPPFLGGTSTVLAYYVFPKFYITQDAVFSEHIHLWMQTVMSFSPRRFSKCMMHGIACLIRIRAASFPSFVCSMESFILFNHCSVIKNDDNRVLLWTKVPWIHKPLRKSSSFTKELKKIMSKSSLF